MDDERPRIFVSGDKAREVIIKAVNKIADVVKMTLGPSGRNALVDRGYRTPRITNDGVFIAQSLDLKDPLEQVVARQLVEVADNTNKEAGDGTTTSIVIAQKLIQKGIKDLRDGGLLADAGSDVMQIKRDIEKSLDTALTELDKQKQKATDKKILMDVATTSLEDSEMSETIADMVLKVGEQGHISVVEGFHGKVETEVIEGMQFDGKYAHQFMCNQENKKAVYEDVSIFLTNEHIDEPVSIQHFTKKFFETGKKEFVFMAPKFSYETIVAFLAAQKRGFNILAVKIPSLTDEQIEDIAAYTGAFFYNKDKGNKLEDVNIQSFGRVDKIEVDDDKVILTGGNKEAAKRRIKQLEAFIREEKDELFRKKYEMRIASLASAVGIIKVASSTEAQKGYMKLKLEDAVFATQHAYKEGVVPGGGKALKKVAETLGKDDILYEALMAPYSQIQENAGGNLKIAKHIVDPIKVTKTALSNACNVAKMMLTTDTVVAIDRLKEQSDALQEIAEVLKKHE